MQKPRRIEVTRKRFLEKQREEMAGYLAGTTDAWFFAIMQKLTPALREAIQLRFDGEGMSYQEMAKALRIDEGTARGRVRKALFCIELYSKRKQQGAA